MINGRALWHRKLPCLLWMRSFPCISPEAEILVLTRGVLDCASPLRMGFLLRRSAALLVEATGSGRLYIDGAEFAKFTDIPSSPFTVKAFGVEFLLLLPLSRGTVESTPRFEADVILSTSKQVCRVDRRWTHG